MGSDHLRISAVTEKLLYLIRDPAMIPRSEPLRKVRRSRVALFAAIELIGFGATIAVTQTIGSWLTHSVKFPRAEGRLTHIFPVS